MSNWWGHYLFFGCPFGNVLPHNVKNGRANETVLNGARKQKWTCILYKRAHDVGSSALEHVMGSLESSGDSRMGSMIGAGSRGGVMTVSMTVVQM